MIRLLTGDCREVLKTLSDESVHCVVTSPPYWGLRDYGVNGQLGLETSLGEHVEAIVSVFREVRRILRKDGTLWLNYGDSYAASPNGRSAQEVKELGADDRTFRDKPFSTIGPIDRDSRVGVSGNRGNSGGDISFRVAAQGSLKPKDLCGIPWRVALALQADGWWLRQDIIWSKPNPMPESVTDRCTKAHEYIFLLSKSERYYYDAEAIAEEAKWADDNRAGEGRLTYNGKRQGDAGTGHEAFVKIQNKRNKRSVWEVATAPFSEAHFATFPPALIEPCILAGCPEKCCAKCGAPWIRDVELTAMVIDRSERTHERGRTRSSGTMLEPATTKTLGFLPSCSCGPLSVIGGVSYELTHGTVLDPFGGAGTTGLVADRLGRSAILVELNPKYAAIAERRARNDAGMFAQIATK